MVGINLANFVWRIKGDRGKGMSKKEVRGWNGREELRKKRQSGDGS